MHPLIVAVAVSAHLAPVHAALLAGGHALPFISAGPTPGPGGAGCASGDPVCDKLKTYAGWIPGWLQYAWILGIGLAVVMGVIGHRRGWDHMREVITALIVASVLISGAATFV